MGLTYGFCLGDDSAQYTADAFSRAFRAITGDGVTSHGRRFAASPNGFTLTVGTGYGFVDGRYVQNTEPLRLTVQPPGSRADRTDALCLRVDHDRRKASVEIVEGMDAAAIRADPSLLRQGDAVSVVLYFIRVRRGATYIDAADITDVRAESGLCDAVHTLSALTARAAHVHAYFTSDIGAKFDALEQAVTSLAEAADAKVQALERQIAGAGAAYIPGDLTTARTPPTPANEWLLCDGGPVPDAYPLLTLLLTGTLPDISRAADRYKTYIYGGQPHAVTVRERS